MHLISEHHHKTMSNIVSKPGYIWCLALTSFGGGERDSLRTQMHLPQGCPTSALARGRPVLPPLAFQKQQWARLEPVGTPGINGVRPELMGTLETVGSARDWRVLL